MTQRFHASRIFFGVAKNIHRHDRIHHRRIDRAQALGVFHAFQHPLFRLGDGRLADATRTEFFPHAKGGVDTEEEIVPGKRAVALHVHRAVGAMDIIEREACRNRAMGVSGVDDRERHQDRARP